MMTLRGDPNMFGVLAFVLWPFMVYAMFYFFRARYAAIAAFVVGTLFLPCNEFPVQFIRVIDKVNLTGFSILLSIMLTDHRRLLAFRPAWIDLPVVLWAMAGLFASLSNELGARDGLGEMTFQGTRWALPWFIGRLYLTDLAAFRELATAIILGGMAYAPLCMVEVVLSPNLHAWTYGYHQHDFSQTVRAGGFRPMVYMPHGLALGLWMTAATLCAW